MHKVAFALSVIICLTVTSPGHAQEDEWIELEDGSRLASSLWLHPNPVGQVLMIHGCLKDRHEFGRLPELLSEAGLSVLAYDMYAHGESQTPALEFNSQEAHDEILGRVPGDARRALALLQGRLPSALPLTLVFSGCTAAWASELVETLPTLERIVLFSGPLHPETHDFLRQRRDLSILAFSANDDVERARLTIQANLAASAGDRTQFVDLPSGGHGAESLLRDHEQKIYETALRWLAGG